MTLVILLLAAILLAPAFSFCTRAPSKPKTAASEECGAADVGPAETSLPAPPGEKPDHGDRLIYRLEAEPGTLNPLTATDVYAQNINGFMEESLLEMDIGTQELKPKLAERYEISPDQLEFTFHLRRGVKWHDGAPLTARDVVYTFQRIMDPKVDAAPIRTYYAECESVTALDDYTVRFRWKKPYFKALELSGLIDIVPRHLLDNGADFNSHPFGRHPVFTGPYRFLAWKTGQEIVLERNPDYWGTARPHLDRIVFKIITDNDAALQLFNQGGLDFMERITPVQWREQTNSPSFLAHARKLYYDYPYYNYIGWNLRRPPFDDRRVRLAMTLTLDRRAILKNIYYCMGSVVSGDAYVQTPYYDRTIPPWPHDPEKAKQLLDEAGWKDRDGDGWRDRDGKPFRFEFLYSSGSQTAEKIATILKEDLQKIGVDMVIRQLDWAVYLEQVQQWNFDACTLGWGLVADPDPYQIWHSSGADIKGSSNHVGFKNAEVDRLIELNRREFDKQKRVQYSHQIHRILHDEQPYTFLLAPKWLSVINSRFHNVQTYPLRPSFKFEEWYVPKELQKYPGK